jgi:hypothetical protein
MASFLNPHLGTLTFLKYILQCFMFVVKCDYCASVQVELHFFARSSATIDVLLLRYKGKK